MPYLPREELAVIREDMRAAIRSVDDTLGLQGLVMIAQRSDTHLRMHIRAERYGQPDVRLTRQQINGEPVKDYVRALLGDYMLTFLLYYGDVGVAAILDTLSETIRYAASPDEDADSAFGEVATWNAREDACDDPSENPREGC